MDDSFSVESTDVIYMNSPLHCVIKDAKLEDIANGDIYARHDRSLLEQSPAFPTVDRMALAFWDTLRKFWSQCSSVILMITYQGKTEANTTLCTVIRSTSFQNLLIEEDLDFLLDFEASRSSTDASTSTNHMNTFLCGIRCRFFFTITIVTMISLWASWQYANCKVWIAVAMCCLTFAPLCKLYLKANSLSFTQLFFPVDEVNMCNCFCQLIDSISDLMSCSTRCICFIQESELVAKGYVYVGGCTVTGLLEELCGSPYGRQCPRLRLNVFTSSKCFFLLLRQSINQLIHQYPQDVELFGRTRHCSEIPITDYPIILHKNVDCSVLSAGTDDFCLRVLKSMHELIRIHVSEFLRCLATNLLIGSTRSNGHHLPLLDLMGNVIAECHRQANILHVQYQAHRYAHREPKSPQKDTKQNNAILKGSRLGQAYVAVHSLEVHLLTALNSVQMLSDDLERSIGNRSCDALKQVEVSSKRSESICAHSLESSGYSDDAKTEFPLEDPLEDPISHHLSHSCISERKSCGTGDIIINPQPGCDFLNDVSVDKGDTTGKCGCNHLGGHARWRALRTTTTQDCGVTRAERREGGDDGYVNCELSFGQPVEVCCGLHRPTRCEARNEPTDVSSDASSVYDVHTEPNCSKCADTGEMEERVRGRWSSIADEKQGKREFDDQCLKTLILIRQQIDMCCECIEQGLQCLSSTTDPLSPASDGGCRSVDHLVSSLDTLDAGIADTSCDTSRCDNAVLDEVFEASSQMSQVSDCASDEAAHSALEEGWGKQQKRDLRIFLRELRSVLEVRSAETALREQAARLRNLELSTTSSPLSSPQELRALDTGSNSDKCSRVSCLYRNDRAERLNAAISCGVVSCRSHHEGYSSAIMSQDSCQCSPCVVDATECDGVRCYAGDAYGGPPVDRCMQNSSLCYAADDTDEEIMSAVLSVDESSREESKCLLESPVSSGLSPSNFLLNVAHLVAARARCLHSGEEEVFSDTIQSNHDASGDFS